MQSQDPRNFCDERMSDLGGNKHKASKYCAGIAAIVRPCGIIGNVTEMYTCESMTQMYLFSLGTFACGKDIQHLKWLGYNRACGFEPFLQNLAKKDIHLAKYLQNNTKFWSIDFMLRVTLSSAAYHQLKIHSASIIQVYLHFLK